MRPGESIFLRAGLAFFFCAVIGYGYFEARGILFGPTIELAAFPSVATASLAILAGTATRVDTLTAGGDPLSLSLTGAFREEYALSPGYNRIEFDATDKYGHAAKKMAEIIYDPGTAISPRLRNASSSETTSADSDLPNAASSGESAARP